MAKSISVDGEVVVSSPPFRIKSESSLCGTQAAPRMETQLVSSPSPRLSHDSSQGDALAMSRQDSQPSRRRFPKHLVEIYDIETMLGSGAFSTVWRCRHRASGQVRAVKKIDASELSPRDIAHEIALMKLLRHPNVVRCYDVFLEANYVNIVVDIFVGGDLIDGLNTHHKVRGRIRDAQLAYLARQMVASIAHVHSLCIVHRDIKGENFVLDRPDIGDTECIVALADFGTAIRLEPGATLTDQAGTRAYWAPEMWKGTGYDFSVDIWALGTTMFVLLNRQLPFNPPTEENICREIDDCSKLFTVPSFASTLCKEFIVQCLSRDRKDRPSALEVARLPWMYTPAPTPVPPPSLPRQYARRGGSALLSMLGVLGSFSLACCGCMGDFCVEICSDNGAEKKDSSKETDTNPLKESLSPVASDARKVASTGDAGRAQVEAE
eukprot:TRINITY_DN43783_c0_g1_i1.p1 TRINITY_DN43783_c0_g1~~TRINITY_DN43783_c0_g1_i1.p1  ORF type:complete len:437 (-),score=62.30 TRINITY_DN43783_c0_g1_i1:35-1345(-)